MQVVRPMDDVITGTVIVGEPDPDGPPELAGICATIRAALEQHIRENAAEYQYVGTHWDDRPRCAALIESIRTAVLRLFQPGDGSTVTVIGPDGTHLGVLVTFLHEGRLALIDVHAVL